MNGYVNAVCGEAPREMRRSGVDCLGDLPWGSHVCQLYRSSADLLEVLVPYFREGLLSNEYCIWITSDILPKSDAVAALRAEVPLLDEHVANGQIDIFDYREWYIAGGAFDGESVSHRWSEKLDGALARGYDGMRLSGDTFWLSDDDWESFVVYEARLDPVIVERPILAICTYALEKLSMREAFDAVANHEYAIVREGGVLSSFKSLARFRSERASRENESRLRATVDGASDGIVTFDAAGIVLLANAAAQQMFGYESYEIIGTHVGALVPDLWEAHCASESFAQSGLDAEARRADQTSFPVQYSLRAAVAREQRVIVGCIRDLTLQREAEERIKKLHSDRVEVIGEMATALAHELNQPLAATTTYLHTAQRLLRMPADARPVSLEKILGSATEQVLRAGKILKNIREFIVWDEPDKSVCHLHQMIEDACMLTQGSARQASVELSLRFRAVDDAVVADRVQIVQVLVNLIRNAIDVMRNAPERKLDIVTSSDSATIRVEVLDTGDGISESQKERFFEPSTTSKASKLGVGLSISRSIIEAHYGEMSASRGSQGGAKVSFTLPLASGPASEAAE